MNTFSTLDWSRTPIRFEINSGIVRVTPFPLANDRVLQMNNTFPVLSDFARLIYFDILDLKSNSSYARFMTIDEPTFFLESYKLQKSSICYTAL